MGTVLNGDPGAAFETFLRWAADVEWRDLEASARQRTVLVLADDMAAAFSAVREPQVALAQARLRAAAVGGGAASLLSAGRPRVSVMQAAMGNGLAMGWNELDEGYRKAVCHAGLYVLPALLAVGEAENASLQDLLRALALGYETATRVARTWRFPSLKIHPHALLAPVGAAAGVGFLRRLPAEELLSAVAGAATLGMAGPFNHALKGVLARNTWAPQAAMAGLNALEWAHCGIGGSETSPHDVYAVALGANADLSVLAPHADEGWAVESGYHKMNACCQYTHSAIEAVQSLLQREAGLVGGAQVLDIEIEAHPLAFALDDRHPTTTLGAKFSLPHAAAAALVHGDGGVASFDAASLDDPRISRLREATRLIPFEGVRAWPEDRPARITLTTNDGSRLAAECWSARGGPDRPFLDTELWDKLATLSRPYAPAFAATLRRAADAAAGAADTAALSRPWREWLDDIFADSPAA
ncbi:MmgE/PrpD family protein [Variovorax sp. J31P207]|uniref:MmgE/PrpD family protein n=1 Tax=Variovorax sp. J31P207 TaxID=3053510 RepID=UPI00257650AC|nr:MmgE/PrpD family protein [Variovorax sp. J31P207]MDM0070633.1 MmgE/PrpD family protein [Variovorax sp. J31P207]